MTAKEIKRWVGDRIRKLREAKGWSQEELGFKSGLHRNYVGRIERGEQNVAVVNLAKLAKALGVRPSELLP
ncbi:MAG: helix-turn-helix transcriptional regulator [Gammaproteobacteria bacterium]|nr:helix-turn-helix transcriptional regulator [Gammaproteobacteria bacterium]